MPAAKHATGFCEERFVGLIRGVRDTACVPGETKQEFERIEMSAARAEMAELGGSVAGANRA